MSDSSTEEPDTVASNPPAAKTSAAKTARRKTAPRKTARKTARKSTRAKKPAVESAEATPSAPAKTAPPAQQAELQLFESAPAEEKVKPAKKAAKKATRKTAKKKTAAKKTTAKKSAAKRPTADTTPAESAKDAPAEKPAAKSEESPVRKMPAPAAAEPPPLPASLPPPLPASAKIAQPETKAEAPAASGEAPEQPDAGAQNQDAEPQQRRFGRVKGGPVDQNQNQNQGRNRNRNRRRRDRDRGRDRRNNGQSSNRQSNESGPPQNSSRDSQPGQQRKQQKQREKRPPQLTGPKIEWEGMLELAPKGFGFLRRPDKNFVQARDDVFVPPDLIRRFGLRVGSWVQGLYQQGNRGQQLVEVTAIDGLPPEEAARRPAFEELKAINPTRRLSFETTPDRFTTRIIDLVAPVGRGQRGLIVSPPRSGKTTLLLHIAEAVREKYEDSLHLMILLVDERPEEVTEFRRALPGAEIFASSNDENARNHTRIAEMAIERAKRLVESGKDVFLLMDSITRLARAYNATMRNKGRGTGSGGITVGALEIPRRLFAAARNTRGGGSLTMLGTALVQTNSRADDAIFQEFKGTGNMELVLDRQIAESYIYPAVDIFKSGTRREELILPEHTLHKIHLIRRGLSGHRPVEAMERLLFFLKKFPNNAQMLLEIKG